MSKITISSLRFRNGTLLAMKFFSNNLRTTTTTTTTTTDSSGRHAFWILKSTPLLLLIWNLLSNWLRFLRDMQESKHSISKGHSWRHTQVTRSSAIAEEPRDASYQLKSCQLPHNSAETTGTTSTEQSKLWSWKVTVGQGVINMCTQPWRDRLTSTVL